MEQDLLRHATDNILTHHFITESGYPVAILYDDEKRPLADALQTALDARGCLVRLYPCDVSQMAGEDIVETALGDQRTGLILLASHRMWTECGLARHLIVGREGPRLDIACASFFFDCILPLSNLLRIYGSDWGADRAYLEQLRANLPSHTAFRVTAPGGTDLRFRAREWLASGFELLTSPIEPSIEGTIVVDASVYFARIALPIELTIRAGRLVSVNCNDTSDQVFRRYVSWMNKDLEASPANAQLAEVGVGVNGGARIIGVVMEDETVRDTCHFCFGDNTRYGGVSRSDWHGGTVIVWQPRFEVVRQS